MSQASASKTGMALAAAAALLLSLGAHAQKTIEAGAAFSIDTSGSGKASLYIVGPTQLVRRDVQLGGAVSFEQGTLYNAGHYVVFANGQAQGELDVVPATKPAAISFLARPSRLPVGLQNGITGAAYVFDSYRNLITTPTAVSFELTTPAGSSQSRTANTSNGAAWIAMDSSPKEGAARFVARAGTASATRVITEVPGDPCSLKMVAKPAGKKIQLETEPVRDCSGNAVPDGTVVTFTATYGGATSTVDVPIKRGVAKVEMPAYPGATITVASGVVLGNQIRWGK